MDNLKKRIIEIENTLNFLKSCEGKTANMPVLEKTDDKDYKIQVKEIEYWYFIISADLHYFISRILYLHKIGSYSLFSGFQCVENYFKAYLKFVEKDVPQMHTLSKLLTKCREISPAPDFIKSDYIQTIAKYYEPFYEIGRYPVQKTKPKKGQYVQMFPDDIYILDYFVYQMRQIMKVPENTWDILKEGKDGGHVDLSLCQTVHPEFYNLFKQDNINFSS